MAASSSSSSGPGWKYGVFLNFNVEDTHSGFVCHLYEALRQKSIDTFFSTKVVSTKVVSEHDDEFSEHDDLSEPRIASPESSEHDDEFSEHDDLSEPRIASSESSEHDDEFSEHDDLSEPLIASPDSRPPRIPILEPRPWLDDLSEAPTPPSPRLDDEFSEHDDLSEPLIAIPESRLLLVVFSQNYASSTRCLKELVEILRCNDTKKQIMVPIFYEVDPSDVRKLSGSFGEAFDRHDAEMDEVRSWRSALKEAANFSGWVSQDFGDDAELIEKIVEDVSGKLSHTSPASIEYDVFINFRGEDTRRGFVSHLYRALHQNSINTYMDAKALRKGDPLSELLTAAGESKISLLVISKNYASSTWCLKELVEIRRTKYTKKPSMLRIPIFYKIDPSHFPKLEDAFATAEIRDAYSSAVRIRGWHSLRHRDDAELIKNIVDDVSGKLICIASTSSKSNGLIEMDSHMHEMRLLLHPPGVETNDVRVVGICGTGGLGKTTIARAVYDEIADQFEAACFLENVKEGFMKLGKLHMQAQLLESILGNKRDYDYIVDEYIENVKRFTMYEKLDMQAQLQQSIVGRAVESFCISNESFQMMLERIGKRKVLVVVDNVDKVAQVEALLGKQHSFGGGSKIIIITRDVKLLSRADAIYEPKIFSDPGALELFRWYTNQPTTDYGDLLRCVIQYAQGLPLALKVLGAFLYNKTVHEWEDVLEKLRKIPERKIHDVLKTSFDGLDDITKDIFLDIACFFKGMNVDSAVKIMGEYGKIGIHPYFAIRVLIDRALITVSPWGGLEMYDSLEEMGREIVRQESLKEPEKQSRLSRYEDVDLERWAHKIPDDIIDSCLTRMNRVPTDAKAVCALIERSW